MMKGKFLPSAYFRKNSVRSLTDKSSASPYPFSCSPTVFLFKNSTGLPIF